MRSLKIFYYILLAATTLCFCVALPYFFDIAVTQPPKYPMMYYSPIVKQIMKVDYHDREFPLRDRKGNSYSVSEFDSLYPVQNYRHLIAKGTMPDSVDGVSLTVRSVNMDSYYLLVKPSLKKRPAYSTYFLYESMPLRGSIQFPEDVFTLDDSIKFFNVATGKLNGKKSAMFNRALRKAGFKGPVEWISGNMNPRKHHDEGFFILDSKGDLYHMKMVNGFASVREVSREVDGEKLDLYYFYISEPANREIYGIGTTNEGKAYRLVYNQDNEYEFQHLDIGRFNPDRNDIRIYVNPLCWDVVVHTDSCETAYALNQKTMECLDSLRIDRVFSLGERHAKWIFPVVIRLAHDDTGFFEPRVLQVNWRTIFFSIFLCVIYFFYQKSAGQSKNWKIYVFLLIFGLPAFLALLMIPKNSFVLGK